LSPAVKINFFFSLVSEAFCGFCKKGMTKKALKEHTAHYCSKNPDVVPREYVCPMCGQIFERDSNLNKHHLAVHVDVKDNRQSTSIQATNKRKNEAKQAERAAKAKIQEEGEE
jgi:hypothetical protein